jgi:acid phosphatase
MMSSPVQAADVGDQNLPQPDHVVVVILENHSFSQIMDPNRAPFIYRLATGGALFVHAFAVSHPSQPNYFALFSGSTQGVHDNKDYMFDAPTLAGALDAAGKSFVGYVEAGSPRSHNPWESFANARAMERDLSEFPSNFTLLPTVSFVIPNLDHDMHGRSFRDSNNWLWVHLGAFAEWAKSFVIPSLDHDRRDDRRIRDGDTWVRAHLGAFAEWAQTHNSLLIVTFDEDDDNAENHIPTIIYGAHVRPGQYSERISHYNVLSTLLAMYALPLFAEAATTPPIRAIWDHAH